MMPNLQSPSLHPPPINYQLHGVQQGCYTLVGQWPASARTLPGAPRSIVAHWLSPPQSAMLVRVNAVFSDGGVSVSCQLTIVNSQL